MGDNQNLFNLGPNKEHLEGEYNVLKEGIYRKSFSVAFQDLLTFNDNFSTIAGIRLDSYSDFGKTTSYKIGAVYNKNDYTLKVLYNNAFRVPSWVELYAKSNTDFNGNENLKPEKIGMLEVIGIKKLSLKDKIKLVYFYGKNKDYIARKLDLNTGKKIYDNLGNYYIRGFEASYERKTNKYNFNFSYSLNKNYYDFGYKISGIDVYDWPGNRENLVKSDFIYKISKSDSFFIGAIYGSKIDTPVVEDVPDYFSINTNYRFKKKSLFITIGVDNLTDHKNYYWIDPSDLIFGKYFFEFEKARIPASGRKFYISLYREW